MCFKRKNLKRIICLALISSLIVYSILNRELKITYLTRRNTVLNFTATFENIINKECNSKSDNTKIDICLKELSKLDDKIQNNRLRTQNHFSSCNHCYIYKDKNLTIYHHTFWQIKDKIHSDSYNFKLRVLLLNVMSFFATQNLCCTKLIFWKLEDFPFEIEIILSRMFKKFINEKIFEIRNFDLRTLCKTSKKIKTSIIKNYPLCKTKIDIIDYNLVSLSDFVRFIVLDLYGGIYTDGDVIYLKETNLLWKKNFAYRWSYTNNYNTAVLGINKNLDTEINQLYDFIFKNNLNNLIFSFHPFTLTSLINSNIYDYKALRVYHSFLFDPAWLCFDGKIDRITNETVCGFQEFNNVKKIALENFDPKSFFKGAFTYHLHLANCGLNIQNDSYFKYFEDFYRKKLRLN